MASGGAKARGTIDFKINDGGFASKLRVLLDGMTKLDQKGRTASAGMKTLANATQGTYRQVNALGSVVARQAAAMDRVVGSMNRNIQANNDMATSGQRAVRPITHLQQSLDKTNRSAVGAAGGMKQFSTSANQAGNAAQRSTAGMQQASAATSKFNANTIGTAASIGTMGAGLVSLEASMSNYTKATHKVEKAELRVKEARKLLDYANNMVAKKEAQIAKAREMGNKSAEEMALLEGDLNYYRTDAEQKIEKMKLAQDKLNIANMDYADTQKLMASSIATTLLGTISSAAQMFAAKSAATAKDTAASNTNRLANIANSKALKMLGFDLTGARTKLAAASLEFKKVSFSAQGAAAGFKGVGMSVKGMIMAMGPIGIIATLAGLLYTAWETSQDFRDAVHWLIDEIQKFFEILKKVIVPLQWLDEGLKALGINVGENIDKWQDETRVIGEADAAMTDMTQTVSQTDTSVQNLTMAVETDTAAMMESKVAVAELDTGMAEMSDTINTSTIPSIGRYTDAMREMGATTTQVAKTDMQTWRQAMADSITDHENHDRKLAEGKEMILSWANTRRQAHEDDTINVQDWQSNNASYLQSAVDHIEKYGGDARAVLEQNGIDWQGLGITVQQTSDSVVSNTDRMASGVDTGLGKIRTSLTSTQASTIQLMHQMEALSKKKYSVLNELKNIQDVSQMTAAQIARVRAEYDAMKINQNLLAQGLPPQGKFFASEEMGSVYVMGDGETVIREDGTIDYDRLQEIGNISARNLAKIKAQSKAKYGKQAAEYLQTIGFSPIMKGPGGVNISVDDKQDLATARAVSQQGSAGLYANPNYGKNPNPQAGASDAKRGIKHRNARDYAKQQDLEKNQAEILHMNQWLGSLGILQSGYSANTKLRDHSHSAWLIIRALRPIYNKYRKIVSDAGIDPDSLGFIAQPYTISRGAMSGHDRRSRVAYSWSPAAKARARQIQQIERAGSFYGEAKADYDRMLKAAGLDNAQIYKAKIVKSDKGKRGSGRTRYSDLVFQYERNFAKPGASWSVQYYTTQEELAKEAKSRQAHDTATASIWETAMKRAEAKAKEAARIAKEKRDKELADKLAAAEAKETRERNLQIYNTQMESYNQDMELYNMIQRMFPDMTPTWKPQMPTLNTGTTTTQSTIDYSQTPAGQAEIQRHTQTLIDAGKWKSEYEGHDVYELRQVIEVHTK